jgi:quercetin dioxygenase-like cupin family protein
MTVGRYSWQLGGETARTAAPVPRTILYEGPDTIVSLLAGGPSEVGAHLHATHDEFGHMLTGAGELWIADERIGLVAGTTWAIPRSTPHRAVFTSNFRVLAWFTPWDSPESPDRIMCSMPVQS